MKQIVWIGFFGMFGAILRTSIGVWLGEGDSFPFATFLVNIVAAVLLCFFATSSIFKSAVFQQAMTVGFLGSFSTFSAFSMETILLVERGQVVTATVYVLFSVIGGIIGGKIGFHYGRKWKTT